MILNQTNKKLINQTNNKKMKKILTTIAIAAAAVVSTQAQGLVFFSSSTQNMSTNGATVGKTTGAAGSFYYALFVSPTATTVGGVQTGAVQGTNGVYAFNDANWTFVAYGTNSPTAGRFQSSSQNADTSTTIPTVAGGAAAQFVVVGWSANLGSTLTSLEQALGVNGTTGFLGESIVSGAITTGNGALIGSPNLFGGIAPSLQAFTLGGFTITSTPEPGTLALAALGGASLLMFRRKNK
jgi:hypothetical protein